MGGNDEEEGTNEGRGGGEGTNGLKKVPWTAAEDSILMEYVKKYGEGNWNAVEKRTGLSCRLSLVTNGLAWLKKNYEIRVENDGESRGDGIDGRRLDESSPQLSLHNATPIAGVVPKWKRTRIVKPSIIPICPV